MAQENELPSKAFKKFTRKGLSPNVPAQNLKESSLFARVSFFFFSCFRLKYSDSLWARAANILHDLSRMGNHNSPGRLSKRKI